MGMNVLEKKTMFEVNETEKTIPGRMLGPDRPEKHSAKCFIRSGEIPSLGHASICKTKDRVMFTERGALARCSDPP